MLNSVADFVRGNAEGRDRGLAINVTGKAKTLVCRIVVVAEEIVGLDHFDVIDLRRVQNFARAFRAGNAGAGAHLPPFFESRVDTKLRPETDD